VYTLETSNVKGKANRRPDQNGPILAFFGGQRWKKACPWANSRRLSHLPQNRWSGLVSSGVFVTLWMTEC